MVCKKCKCVIADDALFCESCGTRVPKSDKKRKNADKKAAKAEQELPPEALVPLTTIQGVGILLAFCVPLLNLILMVKWAYAPQGNESRRSLARAGLVLFGAVLIFAILCLSVFIVLVKTGVLSVVGVV